jgi:gliding motility-associatede transport system auxiliary component
MLNTILGVIGWLGTLLVFAGVAIRLFRPQWDQYAYWAAIAGLVCVLLYTLSQWREIARSFGKRQARFSAMTVLSVVAVLVILIGINYLVQRRDKRWDLTATKSFSLSDQTLKIINGLKTPVKITVVDQPNGFQRFRDALGSYEFASKNVQVEYLDPDRNPGRVKDLGVLNYGTVVLEQNGRRERVMSDREQDLTNALLKVTTGRQAKAYFVEGHGEKDSAGVERTGYSNAIDVLKRDNFTVEKIVLAQNPEVPADASVLIIAGPTADYLQPEVDAIRKYLRKGGKALFLLDPPVGATAHPIPTLEGLLKEWGITLNHDLVLDVSGIGQMLGTDASVPVASSYPPHPVTKDFTLLTAFPLSQSVKGEAGMDLGPSASVQDLIKTSERSWSEADVKSLTSGGKVSLDEKAGDHKGPVTIGLTISMDAPDAPAVTVGAASTDKAAANISASKPGEKPGDTPAPKPQTRIAVLGDSDFASNAAVGIQGNSDLFVNIANWLTQQEDLISIHPRAADDRRISLTADQQRRVAWMSLLLIPGLILGSGVYTWWQRR